MCKGESPLAAASRRSPHTPKQIRNAPRRCTRPPQANP